MGNALLRPVTDYYEGKLAEHGPNPRGVDWNGSDSQGLRFSKLCELLPAEGEFSLLDWGCGYGALLDYLGGRAEFSGRMTEYLGFDISERMVAAAREQHSGKRGTGFTHEAGGLEPRDYVVASGIYNVRLQTPEDQWLKYVLGELDRLNALSRRGYAFNLLSTYSDVEKRKPHLYFADPHALFDYCKRKHSPRVALLHDYPLYEFTLIVRKDS